MKTAHGVICINVMPLLGSSYTCVDNTTGRYDSNLYHGEIKYSLYYISNYPWHYIVFAAYSLPFPYIYIMKSYLNTTNWGWANRASIHILSTMSGLGRWNETCFDNKATGLDAG